MTIAEADLQHLLRRTEFVVRSTRVAALVGGTLDAAVDDILDLPTTSVTVPAPIMDRTDANLWATYVEATHWWMDRMVEAPKPFQEKLTLFWHGHFVSSKSKVNETYLLVDQNQLFRRNCDGNFHDLAQAVAIDPAMLFYLDNFDNTRWSPNQNFARESMELFTLGIGNYTEADVETAAAAWTGHTVDWSAGPNRLTYRFDSGSHDPTPRSFMGVTKSWNGPDVITHILKTDPQKRLLAARFIVSKLWEYFAHPGTPPAVLDALVPQFAADWLIKPMLRKLFLRPEFYSTQAKQGLVRTPIEYMVALMYQTGHRAADVHPEWYMEAMGQVPFNPPNVAGWKSNSHFINTTAVSARADAARQLVWTLRQNDRYQELAAMSIPDAITAVAKMFGIHPVSSTTYNALAQYLTAQRVAEPWQGWWGVTNLLTLGMLAPEMHAA